MRPVPVAALFGALRRSSATVIGLALAALLCAQAALAFYSCPRLTSTVAAADPMPCHEMDPASPALCKAFVQGEAQALDGKRPAIDFSGALAPLQAALPPVMALAARPVRRAAGRAPLRGRAPPLWITFGRRRD
jgi:hypothetical protein